MRQTAIWCVLLFLAWASVGLAQAPRVVFEDQFDGPLKPQWSAIRPTISAAPATGQKYLGPFAGQSVLLNLTDLPEHRYIRLSMDLLIMRSYDGNAPHQGPDIFYIYTDDGRMIYATSFSWYQPQAYPGFFSVHTNPLATGVQKRDTFGFIHLGEPRDGMFHIECIIPHREAKLGLRFLATTQSAITDEAWGILNARVALEEPAQPSANQLAEAWDRLGSDDSAAATAAVWMLVTGGDAAVALLGQKLKGTTLPASVELLDPTRAATRRLVAGRDGFSLSDAAQRQRVLGAHVLQVIGTPGAKQILGGLQTDKPDRMKTVKVIVRDINSRQPLPFMPVWVWTYQTTNYASAVTNSAGEAIIDIPLEMTGQIYFLTPRAGYVPVGKVMPVANVPETLELPVDPSVVIGGTVVDHEGKPLANAPLLFSIRKQYPEPSLITRLDGLNVVSDKDGRWSMDLAPPQPDTLLIGVRDPNAPSEPVLMVDYKPKLQDLRELKATVSMPRPQLIRMKVVDAETGRPVRQFKVRIAPVRAGDIGAWAAAAQDGAAGTLEVRVPPTYDAVVLQIEAEGYLGTNTEPIPREAMEKPLEIKLFTVR